MITVSGRGWPRVAGTLTDIGLLMAASASEAGWNLASRLDRIVLE